MALLEVEALRDQESRDPAGALQAYQKFQKEQPPLEPFSQYQDVLKRELDTLQGNPESGKFSAEAVLGFPDTYLRAVMARVQTHQGLGRLYLHQKQFAQAEEAAAAAIKLMKSQGGLAPDTVSLSLMESYRILQESYQGQGLKGKALLARLSGDLLQDHLNSEKGAETFYAEKVSINGKQTQTQVDDVKKFVKGVNDHRDSKNSATASAVMGGVMQANSLVQSSMASQALMKSGGVMTPKVQMAQMNAQFAQFQALMFTAIVKVDAGQAKGLGAGTNPWSVPTFSQQLVDPRMGVNSRGIVKGFAADAATAGGSATLQQGAQQVIQGVDALPTVQASSDPQAIVKSVESFAGVFNALLTQVQEIKAAK